MTLQPSALKGRSFPDSCLAPSLPPTVNFVSAQIEGVSEKETTLKEKWAIGRPDQRPAETDYDTEAISNQFKNFVANFPSFDQEEWKLLFESLVESPRFSFRESNLMAISILPRSE